MKKGRGPYNKLRKHEISDKRKALAASALAHKIGYLRLKYLPGADIFEKLPTLSLPAHRVIRGHNKLFLLREGEVEIWNTHHDTLVKKLEPGALFGEMPLLGQTMLVTRAMTGPPGATVGVMNVDSATEWISSSPVEIFQHLGPELSSAQVAHYRAAFQTADSRVSALLLELAGEDSTVSGLTHDGLGHLIGLYRETVTNMLDALKSAKLIEIGRQRIELLNKKALKELSEI